MAFKVGHETCYWGALSPTEVFPSPPPSAFHLLLLSVSLPFTHNFPSFYQHPISRSLLCVLSHLTVSFSDVTQATSGATAKWGCASSGVTTILVSQSGVTVAPGILPPHSLLCCKKKIWKFFTKNYDFSKISNFAKPEKRKNIR